MMKGERRARRLEELKFLMTRESVTEPPQYYIATWQGPGLPLLERRLSDYPHPYPSLKVAPSLAAQL